MQPQLPVLSAFIDFLHDNELVTVCVGAAPNSPWGDGVPFSRDEVVAELTEATKFQTGTVPGIVYKSDGSCGKKAYWEAQAPGEDVVWTRGGISRGTKGAVRWEAFQTENGDLIYADLRLIPLINPSDAAAILKDRYDLIL